jgi:hypothetical protein
MSGFLLHLGATVICAHAGQSTPPTSNPRVKVGGQPVVTMPSTYTIAGCALPTPPVANGPCATGQWITAATRVRVGSQPVLLSTSQSLCVPTGTPMTVVATQTRVRGS